MWFRFGRWNRSSLLKAMERGRRKFADKDLSSIDLSDTEITYRDFANSNLQGANFSGSKIATSSFRHANLHGSDFRGAHFSHCDFRDADIGEVGMEEVVFSECSGLGSLPLAVVRDSFGKCNFEERLAFVLSFLEEYPGTLAPGARQEATPVQKTVAHAGREAVLSLTCGGNALGVTLALEENRVGVFQLWRTKELLRPQFHSSCGGPVFDAPELPEELSPMIWAMALPVELAYIKRRLASLGEIKDQLFDVLSDPNVRMLRVTEKEVYFELGPFFQPGIRESIDAALGASVSLARRLEGQDRHSD